MHFIFSSLFWGVLIILIGVSIILNSVFNINIPVFKIFFAICFIYIGISIIVGSTIRHGDNKSTIFAESKMIKPQTDEYNTIFGKSELDLREMKIGDKIKIATIFGDTRIYISSQKPYRINGSSAFGELKTPANHTVNFGSLDYQSDSYKDEKLSIIIEASVVFGNIEIKENNK
jgi:predicted membrane protein